MPSLLYLPESPSTNEDILHCFPWQDLPGSALYTFNQTHGRGQYGNRWLAPPGVSLAFSYAAAGRTLAGGTLFNYHTAVLLRAFLADFTGAEVMIKWPNDLIIHGKKVAGILIERRYAGDDLYIVGIGINVLSQEFGDLVKAGSLQSQCGAVYDLPELAHSLYACLNLEINRIPAPDEVLSQFNEHLFRKESVSVFRVGGVCQNGIIRGAEPEGTLLVEMEYDGPRRFHHKEVELLY